jgi:hypothetical protein
MKIPFQKIIIPRILFIKLSLVILAVIGIQSCTAKVIHNYQVVYNGLCTPVAFEKESSEEIKVILDYDGNKAYTRNRDIVLHCIEHREPIQCKVFRSGQAECEIASDDSTKREE